MLLSLEPDEVGLQILRVLVTTSTPGVTPSLENMIALTVGDGGIYVGPVGRPPSRYPGVSTSDIKLVLREAWAWLEGAGLLIPSPNGGTARFLSRRAKKLAAEDHPMQVYRARQLPKETLHLAIREDVWSLFHRGQFELAIVAAMRAVEVAVRDAAGFTNADHGKDMIARAFNPKAGPLRDDMAEPAERDALMGLMTGAFGLYRNAYAHRHVGLDDPEEAAEIIMLANHLLRIVDARRPSRPAQASKPLSR